MLSGPVPGIPAVNSADPSRTRFVGVFVALVGEATFADEASRVVAAAVGVDCGLAWSEVSADDLSRQPVKGMRHKPKATQVVGLRAIIQ
jgi:hypothetical protein